MDTKVHDLELSEDQIAALIDDEAKRRYELTAADLVAQYRDGTIDPCGGAADLIALARLLSEDHPLHLDA